jgi:hypothetical protein
MVQPWRYSQIASGIQHRGTTASVMEDGLSHVCGVMDSCFRDEFWRVSNYCQDSPKEVSFQTVSATSLRAILTVSGSGGQYGGVGVKEWAALAPTAQ